MTQLLLIVSIGGSRVAFPSAAIESVVELDTLIPVPRAAPHVAGLSALRSRVLTVIDSLAALNLVPAAPGDTMEAIVVPSGGHTYALLVEAVEDVVEAGGAPSPFQAPAGAGWDRVATGMIEAHGDLLLLADPHAFIAGPPLSVAA